MTFWRQNESSSYSVTHATPLFITFICFGLYCIINNEKLKQIFKYGPKFRETPYLDTNKLSNLFKTELDTLTTKISQKFKISRSTLKDWRSHLFEAFTNKMDFMVKNIK